MNIYTTLLIPILLLFGTISYAQHDYYSVIQFNVPVGSKIVNSGGLEVGCTLTETTVESIRQATLDGEPEKFQEKRNFILFITVTNTGTNDIIILDWTFQATCPENNMGLQWQEYSRIPLITPYVDKSEKILLKPGEKKSFYSAKTNFYWCLPKHEDALMAEPCGIIALINCGQVGTPIYTNGLTNDFTVNNCEYTDYDELEKNREQAIILEKEFEQLLDDQNFQDQEFSETPLDTEILALIDEHNLALKSGNLDEAEGLKNIILEIAEHAYPNQLDEINALLKEASSKTQKTSEKSSSNSIVTKVSAKVIKINIDGETYYLTTEIGYPIIGDYLYEANGDPIFRLNADGTGLVQMHGMNRTKMVWGIECQADGTPMKQDAPWGGIYVLWYQIKEQHTGQWGPSGTIDSWDGAQFSIHTDERKIYIWGERIKSY